MTIKLFNEALINNSKIAPFKGLCFEDALNCSSCKKGFCKLDNICYARRDATTHEDHHRNTLNAANALNNILSDDDTTNDFIKYLKIKDYKVIRFNLVGDFKTADNIHQLEELATATPTIKYYGYTKRHDLKNELKELVQQPNIYLNSDLKKIYTIKGVNRYNVHTKIKNYYLSNNKCGGRCSGCGYCYTLKNSTINTFIHSTPSHLQRYIKTDHNTKFLLNHINRRLNLNVDVEDVGGGFYVNSFIELLNNNGIMTPTNNKNKQVIKTVPDLLKFIDLRGLINE